MTALDVDALLEQAEDETGLSDYGDATLRERVAAKEQVVVAVLEERRGVEAYLRAQVDFYGEMFVEVSILMQIEDLQAEIQYIVRCLLKWHEQGTPWKEIAILYPGGVAGKMMARVVEARTGIPREQFLPQARVAGK